MNDHRERYIVAPARAGETMIGSRHAFRSRFDPAFDVAARAHIFLPIDGSAAARRLLDIAIALARPSAATVTLVGLDDGGERGEALRRVLLPAQARVEASGVLCERRMLDAAHGIDELLGWIATAGDGSRLVLGDPLKLAGALRELTSELLLERPCPLYLLSLDGDPIGQLRLRLRALLLRGRTRAVRLRHGEIAR